MSLEKLLEPVNFQVIICSASGVFTQVCSIRPFMKVRNNDISQHREKIKFLTFQFVFLCKWHLILPWPSRHLPVLVCRPVSSQVWFQSYEKAPALHPLTCTLLTLQTYLSPVLSLGWLVNKLATDNFPKIPCKNNSQVANVYECLTKSAVWYSISLKCFRQ